MKLSESNTPITFGRYTFPGDTWFVCAFYVKSEIRLEWIK
jgi:hypothetical protein